MEDLVGVNNAFDSSTSFKFKNQELKEISFNLVAIDDFLFS